MTSHLAAYVALDPVPEDGWRRRCAPSLRVVGEGVPRPPPDATRVANPGGAPGGRLPAVPLAGGSRPPRPACMSAREQTTWDMFNHRLKTPGVTPCADCLAPFAAEMVAAGKCDGYPGRARYCTFVDSAQGRKALDPVERRERRLASWRKYGAARRARTKAGG